MSHLEDFFLIETTPLPNANENPGTEKRTTADLSIRKNILVLPEWAELYRLSIDICLGITSDVWILLLIVKPCLPAGILFAHFVIDIKDIAELSAILLHMYEDYSANFL